VIRPLVTGWLMVGVGAKVVMTLHTAIVNGGDLRSPGRVCGCGRVEGGRQKGDPERKLLRRGQWRSHEFSCLSLSAPTPLR